MSPLPRARRVLPLLLAALALLLAACGGQPPAAQPTAASEPAAVSEPAPPTAETIPSVGSAPAPTPAAEPTAAPAAGAGGTLRVHATSAWPVTLDPQKAANVNEIAALVLAYEGLTRFDAELNTIPAAAESWEYNADATQITFTLREGLAYSDGAPLTAQAFVDAVRRTLDPRSPGGYQASLPMIVGADAVVAADPGDEAALAGLFEQVGVSAPDERTVVFDLTQPTPYFHSIAALWMFYPARQELVEQGGETWWEQAELQVGNGPFAFETIDRANNRITFRANPNYWAGAPKLDAVEYLVIGDLSVAFQAYQNGEIDIFTPDANDLPLIRADPALSQELSEAPGGCTDGYYFNTTLAPFDNPKVRQAFAAAFDREGYARDVAQGAIIPTTSWIPPGLPGYAEDESQAYDVERAKALLAEAGYPEGQGLPEIKWSYSSNNPASQARVEWIIQMYQRNLGVALTPDPIEGTTLSELMNDVSTHPQIAANGWCGDYPDPQNWMSVVWHSRSQLAAEIGYQNPEVDKLLDEADALTDEARRAELYAEAQRLVLADAPFIVRANSKNIYMIKPGVQGIEASTLDSGFPGMFTSLYNVTVAE